jgi:hypothetical protein
VIALMRSIGAAYTYWLKGDVRWVQNVVRQFGRYLLEVSVV